MYSSLVGMQVQTLVYFTGVFREKHSAMSPPIGDH